MLLILLFIKLVSDFMSAVGHRLTCGTSLSLFPYLKKPGVLYVVIKPFIRPAVTRTFLELSKLYLLAHWRIVILSELNLIVCQ